MVRTLRRFAGRVKRRLLASEAVAQPPAAARAPGQGRRQALVARIEELEAEVQECRRLNMRIAELTDVVQELLLPVAQRDEELLRERLEKYSGSL
jgi:hypothetical protein